MPVEFIGMISHSASRGSGYGGPVDPEFVKTFTRAHEASDFDRVLVGYGSSGPDGWSLATWGAAATDRIGFLVAHRPGFVQPTLAARKAATIDQLTGGRVAVHIITGGNDAEERRDGDFLDKDTRYERTDEYLDIVRKTWTSETPFDHHGRFYNFEQAFATVKPVQKPHIPIYFGGSSDAALRVGAKQADVWATWGEPVEAVREQIRIVKEEAAKHGRTLKISVSLRPILAATEEKAWERAYAILDRLKGRPGGDNERTAQNTGTLRLLKFAQEGDVLDKRLFMAIARVPGSGGSSTAPVGTPEQVAETLLDYVDAGADTLLIRGFDPLDDAIDYGRELIPLVRQEIARRHSALGREASVAPATVGV